MRDSSGASLCAYETSLQGLRLRNDGVQPIEAIEQRDAADVREPLAQGVAGIRVSNRTLNLA